MMKGAILALAILAVASVPAGAVLLDETNATLAGDASSAYSPLATPNDGSTPNYIIMGQANPPGAGSATWSVGLTPGQKYKLTTRRTVLYNNELRYDIYFNGVRQITDLAFGPDTPDQMMEWTALGYILPTVTDNTVVARDPGAWAARIDWLRLDPTYDVYFDENTPVTYQNNGQLFTFGTNGSWPWNPGTLPITGPNGFIFDNGAGPATITGNVTLVPGGVYRVYASRQVIANDNLSFDVNIGGQFFAHCDSVAVDPNHVEFLEEKLLGTYTAAAALTEVQLANPGPWAGRADFVRFELIPEPGTLLALCGGLFGFAGLVVRRRR